MKTVITHENEYPIQPQHIDATNHFWDAFGNRETEVSAGWIVRLCQAHGSWRPFTGDELTNFYATGGHRNFTFNRLVSEGLIVLGEDGGHYCVTHEFIASCFKSSPLLMTTVTA